MSSDQEKRPLSASSWTGLPEPTLPDMLGQHYQIPVTKIQQHKAKMTALLFFAGCLLYGAWFFLLTFHSPTSPSPTTGHTEPWRLLHRSGSSIFITETEKWVSVAFLLTPLLLAAGYRAWDALRRRFGR